MKQVGLKRELSLPVLILYGLGTTIGAGIYALMGEVAGAAGIRTPIAFVVAALAAGLTAFGFAELAGRIPKAAGEAVFVDRAFHFRFLTTGVGAAVILAGLVAAAAIINAFGGYITQVVDVPSWGAAVMLGIFLGAVAISGAKESVGLAAAITVVEIGGLGLVIWAGHEHLTARALTDMLGPPGHTDELLRILGGAFVAFFAFLGFEDIDAVAEETNDPTATLPRAVMVVLGLTTLLYVAVSTVAVATIGPDRLANSPAPLARVYESTGGSEGVITVIAALAMVNGALVQIMMVPRVVYGLSNLRILPRWSGVVSRRTDTPVRATVATTALVITLAATVELGPLARVTSAATIGVFVAINAALIAIRKREGPALGYRAPRWVPYGGILISASMFVAEIARQIRAA